MDVNQDGNLSVRPNEAMLVAIGDGRTKLRLLGDPSDVSASTEEDGAVGRNAFRTNGLHNVDLAPERSFPTSREHEAHFRIEGFSEFDQSHYNIPVRILVSPAFGISLDNLIPAREIRLGLDHVF